MGHLRRTTASRKGLAESAAIFAALGDPTRLRLVNRLCETGPLSIAQLAVGEPVTRQAVSKHLQALEAAGITRSSRDGRRRIWELQPDRLVEVRRHLETISSQWDDAIGRLRNLVERD